MLQPLSVIHSLPDGREHYQPSAWCLGLGEIPPHPISSETFATLLSTALSPFPSPLSLLVLAGRLPHWGVRRAPLRYPRTGSLPASLPSACTRKSKHRQLFSCRQLSIGFAFPKEMPWEVPKLSEGLWWAPLGTAPIPPSPLPFFLLGREVDRCLLSRFAPAAIPGLKPWWFSAMGEEPGAEELPKPWGQELKPPRRPHSPLPSCLPCPRSQGSRNTAQGIFVDHL